MAYIRVTEEKAIKIGPDCVDNPIYLKWIGKRGGWNYWLFGVVQSVSANIRDAVDIERHVTDIETAEERLDFLSKKEFKTITVGASNIDLEDINGLKSILASPKVYEQFKDGTKIGVRVAPGSFRLYETTEKKASIELTLEYPELYVQTQ